MSSLTLIINGVIAVISVSGLVLAGYAWMTSIKANRKAEQANRMAQRSHQLSKESISQKRIKILEMQCQIIRTDLDTLKKLYNSIKTASGGRISDASLEKMHMRIEKRAVAVDTISDYVHHKTKPKDEELISLEQKIISIEQYAAAQRASACESLEKVIPVKSRRRFRRDRRY